MKKLVVTASSLLILPMTFATAIADGLFLNCDAVNTKSHAHDVSQLEITNSAVYLNGEKFTDDVEISDTAIAYELTVPDGKTTILYRIDRTSGKFTGTFIHNEQGTRETTWIGSCEKTSTPARRF